MLLSINMKHKVMEMLLVLQLLKKRHVKNKGWPDNVVKSVEHQSLNNAFEIL